MKLRLILLVAATATLATACTKRDASLVTPAESAPATAPAAAAPAAAAAPSSSANLTMSPATGEMKDRSWAGQVNEAKATASATANAAQERADKADAATK